MTAPRPLDALDRLLGADPDAVMDGVLVCFQPVLPSHATEAAAEALWRRYRLRWDEYWGPTGDRVRLLEARRRLLVDADGVLRHATTNAPLRSLPDEEAP